MMAVLMSKVKTYAGDSLLPVFLYACTIFLSAFLLFQLQPIIGKMILPWFGGSAAVWSTCLLFFQVLLLFGYLYAHWITRTFAPKTQAWIHILLLAASLLTLPITPDIAWKPAGEKDPTLLIIGLMAATVGLPYFLLSATGPLVQAWFARERAGTVPYRLFALSNFGSMLGLLSFPVLFEPWFGVPLLSAGWSTGYIGFALICGMLAWRGRRAGMAAGVGEKADVDKRPDVTTLALWIILAACPTILLMSVTSHLAQNVAPTPFLWVLPLGLYLLSFIMCFEGRAWYRRAWYLPVFLLGLGAINLDQAMHWTSTEIIGAIVLYCGVLFISCMVCHGELAKRKPHARYLTYFYLMIAIGGAVGGTFVALVAPRLFNGNYELPLGSLATITVFFTVIYSEPADPRSWFNRKAWLRLAAFAVVIVSLTVAFGMARFVGKQKVMARNFYGTLRIVDSGKDAGLQRKMVHGSITHGSQYLNPERRKWPTTYYGENGGAGMAIVATRNGGPQRVGIVGLGAGTLAAYGRAADTYRFYEINPLVIELARSEFTFLSDSAAAIDMVLGDARLSMEREPVQNFDVLAVDAFSGDSVPVHLLTREAFDIYFRNIRPGGVLAVHISNNNLDLAPVVKAAADSFGKQARIVDTSFDAVKGLNNSTWVLIGDRADIFNASEFKGNAREINLKRSTRPWTDDYSSMYTILK
ncbi:fused MFS/spermidine synthase [Noviherbaspirillum saxi]|uniref:Spermidine synthase n=1 Tax=Noviherbaspirillum saxi TaxID=2320863 RepID=A0A3A3FM64_9BURK|nr:fused MFS/spermidine synthase [Noviherbaspirillum saxi]RJF92622.1 hypothetical protein D3871_28980 [Noviherbaspirillum saxi]